MLSQADREEINNPDDHPGVTWMLNPYKSGKRWARVVKPTYGCQIHEHKQQRCECTGSRLNKRDIDLDRYIPAVEEPPVLPTRPPVVEVKDKSIRETIMNWFKRDAPAPEPEAVVECKWRHQETAMAVVEFIISNRLKHNEWAFHFPESPNGGTDALLAVIGHVCDYEAVDFKVSKHNAFRIWAEVLGRPSINVTHNLTARGYQQVCKPLIALAKNLFYPTCDKSYNEQVNKMKADKTQVVFFKLQDKWSFRLGDDTVDVIMGGIPSETQVTIGDFYQFHLTTGECKINVSKGASQPLIITIGRDFKIIEVCDKNGTELETFSVDAGHVLLDMLMVYIPLSRVAYGN